jgi:VIT1/CCC1 family predicted Fe2+/Mn2+ transporter
MHNTRLAMRISNLIAIVTLFIAGFAYGRVVGRSPKGFGIGMILLGGILTLLTIVLGG